MSDLMRHAVVRLFRQRDAAVVGTGFLVKNNAVLTCAHVVHEALDRSNNDGFSHEDLLMLDFPFLAPGTICRAQVSWFPEQADESNDLALLRLEDDPPSRPKVHISPEV